MKRIKILLSLGILLLTARSAMPHDRAWPGKRLANLWPEAAKFTSKQVNLTAAQIAGLEADGITLGAEDKSPVFYFATAPNKGKNPGTLGIILFIDAYGENGNMEISVGIAADGAVKKLTIWEHSENKNVASREFLEQFIGKKRSEPLKAGDGYQPAEGALKASDAVALAVKKALAITDAVYGRKPAPVPAASAKTGQQAPGQDGGRP